METHYLSVAFGPGRKYGIILPYDPTRSDDQDEMQEFRDREIVGRCTILYDGSSFTEARGVTQRLKSLKDLLLEQDDNWVGFR